MSFNSGIELDPDRVSTRSTGRRGAVIGVHNFTDFTVFKAHQSVRSGCQRRIMCNKHYRTVILLYHGLQHDQYFFTSLDRKSVV